MNKFNSNCALSLIGLGATIIFTARAAIKVKEELDDIYEYEAVIPSKREIAKVVVPHLIPPIISGTFTTAVILSNCEMSKRRELALLGLLSGSETAYNRLKEQMLDSTINKVKNADLVPKRADNRHREEICCEEAIKWRDNWTGRFFYATINEVVRAEYDLNRRYALTESVLLNDFYDLLGLPPSADDNIGWSFPDDLFVGCRWIEFDHMPATDANEGHYILISFPFPPTNIVT